MKVPHADRAPGETIAAVECIPLEVPFRRPLGTSAARLTHAPLLALNVRSSGGLVGHAYVFCYRTSGTRAVLEVMRDMAQVVAGLAIDPRAVAALVERRFALVGVVGVVRMAASVLDMALWDIVAKAAGGPLWKILDGNDTPIPAYNSNGLGLVGPAAVGDEAASLLEGGFRAVKLRVGYATVAEDVAAFEAVRRAVGPTVQIMTDYNQALEVPEAIRRGRALQMAGAAWVEEPIRHDDWDGCAAIERALDVPLVIGENFDGAKDLRRAHELGAFDGAMPDLGRIGGVTGWLDCARYAAGHSIPLSSHIFPEVSAQVLAATSTAQWLEWTDWAAPILAEPLGVADGSVIPPDRIGSGIAWNDAAIAKYRIG